MAYNPNHQFSEDPQENLRLHKIRKDMEPKIQGLLKKNPQSTSKPTVPRKRNTRRSRRNHSLSKRVSDLLTALIIANVVQTGVIFYLIS